jgi:hypothetical protein
MTKKKTLSKYVLNAQKMKRLPDLECNICRQRLQIGDVIIRKHRKVFHKSCWDSTWIDISDDILTPEEEYLVENGFYPNEQMNTITLSSISISIQMNNF